MSEGPYWPTAGGSYYKDALRRLHKRGGAFVAVLVPEPNNPHDRNAIRVDIEGETVGHIPKDLVGALRPAIEQLARAGRPARIRATVDWGDRGALEATLEGMPGDI